MKKCFVHEVIYSELVGKPLDHSMRNEWGGERDRSDLEVDMVHIENKLGSRPEIEYIQRLSKLPY